MGNEAEKKLTINDPVDPQSLKRMGDIQNRRLQLGEMMLDLEQEKVKILVETRQLENERSKLFAHILTSRGIGPSTPVEVDPNTGKISLLGPNAPAPPAAEEAPAEPPNIGTENPTA